MALTALLAIVRKDLQIFLSDRRSVITAFAMPIAIGSFFGYIFAGNRSSDDIAKVPVVIVDLDHSAVSGGITQSIAGDKNLTSTPADLDSARAQVRRGSATVAIVIPSGFGDAAGRAFFRGTDKPQLQFLYDPSHGMELAMVRGLMTQHVMESVSREVFGNQNGGKVIDDALSEIDAADRAGTSKMSADERTRLRDMLESIRRYNRTASSSGDRPSSGAGGISMPYEVREEAVTSGNGAPYNGFAHSFAGMGIQFMLFSAINLGIEILVERQRGLWKRLRSAPVSKLTLLGAKIVSGTLIGALVLLVSFGFAIVVWHVRIQGSIIGFIAIVIASSLMSASYGLLVATIGKTPSAARGGAALATLLMVMLGGAWVPTFVFPRWLQQLTLVVPTRWSVDGFDAMTWRGFGLSAAIVPTLLLVGFAILFGAFAMARFRWEES